MTGEEAIKTISKMLAITDLTVRGNMTAKMVEACRMAIEALKQGDVLNNVRVEIEKKKQKINFKGLDSYEKAQAEMRLSTLNEFLQIIDKYRAEQEGEK